MHRAGSSFAALLAGEGGETAILAFDDSVRMVQEFTDDSVRLSKTLRNLRVRGDGCAVVDAIAEGLRLLGTRGDRRRVILVIGEKPRPLQQDAARGFAPCERIAKHVNLLADLFDDLFAVYKQSEDHLGPNDG